MSSIVNIFLFFIKVSVPAPFRHRYRFKSIGYVSDKNQTIPIPSQDCLAQSSPDMKWLDHTVAFNNKYRLFT